MIFYEVFLCPQSEPQPNQTRVKYGQKQVKHHHEITIGQIQNRGNFTTQVTQLTKKGKGKESGVVKN